MMIKIWIDLDKRCAKCKRKGVTQNGLCLKCTTKVILNRIKEQQEGK